MSGVLFKWHTHNLQQSLQQMFQSETMVDVTLAVEGQLLKAHRVVLCACSKYFSSMLSSCTNYHPIIFMRDVKADEMKALLNFMYTGEATVSRDLLTGVLKTAEALQITGLTSSSSSSEPQLYVRVGEMSQCDENDFVTLVLGSQVTNDKRSEAVSVENVGAEGSDGALSETLCLDSIDCAVEEKSLGSIGSECFLLSGSLASACSTTQVADTVLLSTPPESTVIISTANKIQKDSSLRPPGRQYTKEDLKEALEQIRAGKMGIKPAARAYNIPVATLHNATRRFNITSPMQQGANFGPLHARQIKLASAATTATDATNTTAVPCSRP